MLLEASLYNFPLTKFSYFTKPTEFPCSKLLEQFIFISPFTRKRSRYKLQSIQLFFAVWTGY